MSTPEPEVSSQTLESPPSFPPAEQSQTLNAARTVADLGIALVRAAVRSDRVPTKRRARGPSDGWSALGFAHRPQLWRGRDR